MAARRVLTWASNQREIPTEKNRDKSGEDDDENDDIETPGGTCELMVLHITNSWLGLLI